LKNKEVGSKLHWNVLLCTTVEKTGKSKEGLREVKTPRERCKVNSWRIRKSKCRKKKSL